MRVAFRGGDEQRALDQEIGKGNLMSDSNTRQRPTFLGPHEARELALMLEGKKHLSYFFFEVGIERKVFPEEEFDGLVARGLLIKDERVESFISPETGKPTSARDILYATVD